jgi:hypothetical protein
VTALVVLVPIHATAMVIVMVMVVMCHFERAPFLV